MQSTAALKDPDPLQTPGRFQRGTGVWFSRLMKDGSHEMVAATISSWNNLSGCYYVTFDADHHRGAFAAPARVIERFAGEVAPGIVGAAV